MRIFFTSRSVNYGDDFTISRMKAIDLRTGLKAFKLEKMRGESLLKMDSIIRPINIIHHEFREKNYDYFLL